jgi:apolipoprotein N-acyltransferase
MINTYNQLSSKHYAAALLSGLLLALPFNFSNLYLLSWFGFIPLLWSLRYTSLLQAYRLGIVCGFISYSTASIWTLDFLQLFSGISVTSSLPIGIIFWFYCAHLPALLCVTYRYINRYTTISPVLVFPTLVAAFYAGFPTMLSPQLGESQSDFIIAIQAVDITGVHGLDFVIGLSNISLYLLLFSESPRYRLPLATATLTLILWLSYGAISYPLWETKIKQWPSYTIGLVQPNEIPSAELPPPEPGYTRAFPPEMPMTEKLVEQGAQLIIWPETRYKGYFRYRHIQQAFSHQATKLATPIIFQDTERTTVGEKEHLFNTVAVVDQYGIESGYYRKFHRVPFAEYIPLLERFDSLKQYIYPYLNGFFTDFSKGNGPTSFKVDTLTLVPLICYEVMFSDYAAKAIGNQGAGKILIGLSNNGWFGDSLLPYQHINASLLRSIENRVPLIHVTNNGPSLIVSPSGRRLYQTPYHQRLALLANIPYSKSSGGSFYSKHPDLFINIIYILLFVIIFLGIKEHLTPVKSR